MSLKLTIFQIRFLKTDHSDDMALAYREMMDYSVLTVTDWPLLLYLVLVCCPSGSSSSLL